MTNQSLNSQMIYSVYVRNHSQEGNFKGVEKDLDRIKRLGTDIIWLMPIHEIGKINQKGELGCPYSIYDYKSINHEYGTMAEFEELVEAIHQKGMKVIIDVVYNHTSHESVLYQEHPEYFIKDDNGKPYCKAGDWSDVIDLDYNQAELRETLIETLVFWVNKGVDGFRCDVGSFVPVSFWKQAREACAKVNPDTIWLAESVEPHFLREMRSKGFYCATDKELYEVFDILYDYDINQEYKDFVCGKVKAEHFVKAVQSQFLNYPEGFIKLRFLENHDQPRIASLVNDPRKLDLLTVMSFLIKGTTLVYAGQEARNEVTPSLFDKETVNWQTLDNDYANLICFLSEWVKKDIVAKGNFDISAEGNLVKISYSYGNEELITWINFGSHDHLLSSVEEENVICRLGEVMVQNQHYIIKGNSAIILQYHNKHQEDHKVRERGSGILLHISSLPGDYGIGDFGKGAYDFVDFLEASGQKNWQILPIGITGFGDSPYQSFSAFAGNPYFIDLNELIQMGFLDKKTVAKTDFGKNKDSVDYEKLYLNKMPLLKMAYENAKVKLQRELDNFYEREKEWLDEFSLYMAIKAYHNNVQWTQWEPGFENINASKVGEFRQSHHDEIQFWIFTQYFFFKQWYALKSVANSKGIKIIGDLPIYVAEDSADVWGNPKLFKLNQHFKPICVAGCPPDAFSATGQLWGNPIYDWDYMKEQGYEWWIKRIRYSLELFDTVRIDHFRGFEAYWQIPYGDPTAEGGKWVKGPGKGLFDAIKNALGDVDIIAEDLGYLTQGVINLREYTGFPGMKVLQFAFDTREESDYLPHNFSSNFVAYTGTHDNDTVIGWMNTVAKPDKEFAIEYLNLDRLEGYHWGFIRGVWSSTAYLAVAQMQDFLGLDSSARMNYPSTLGGNWLWRINPRDLTDKLAKKIARVTQIYGR